MMKLKLSLKKTCCLVMAAASIGGMALAASPQAVYEEAARNMAAHPQGSYTIQLGMKMPFVGEGAIVNTTEVQERPFVVQSQTKTTGFAQTVAPKTAENKAYVMQDGKKLNAYYNADGTEKTWQKKSYDLKKSTPIADYLTWDHNILAGVKSVTSAGGNDYNVVFDASRIYHPADKVTWKKEGMTDEQIRVAARLLQGLQQCGDVKTVVTIDPASKRITRISLPLTEQLRSLALTLIDEYGSNDTDKAAAQSFVKLSELSLTVDCTALPKGTVLSVPEKVIKAAK